MYANYLRWPSAFSSLPLVYHPVPCRCAIASSDLANYNTCTGKCKVQRAGKPQSLNNIRCVRRILREPSSPFCYVAVSPLVVIHPVSALFLTGLSFVIACPRSFPSTIPLHNHRDLPLDTCHRKTLLPADARCVASPRATCRISNVMSFPIAFLVEARTKGRRFQKGKSDRRSHSNYGFDAILHPRGSIVDRTVRNQIVPRFYFQKIARNVILLQALLCKRMLLLHKRLLYERCFKPFDK